MNEILKQNKKHIKSPTFSWLYKVTLLSHFFLFPKLLKTVVLIYLHFYEMFHSFIP